MMDKIKGLIKQGALLLVLICCIVLTGCEDEGEYVDTDDINSHNSTSGLDVAYSFLYNGYNIDVGEEWSDISSKLGEYNSSFVAESCAYQGTDRYYYYDNFEVMTSEIDGKELLTDIYIEKENVIAAEGVYVGMSLADVAKNMGPADKTTDTSYVYYGGRVNIQINARDDKVISIEYYFVQE